MRTHAQKYFLKQRREETAQLKNANTMARKRRLISAAAGGAGNGAGAGGLPEEEELEEEEEDEEDDMEEDEELDDVLGPSHSASSSMAIDTHEGSTTTTDDSNGGIPRRKSTRVTNAAAVIKMRTQDVVAHLGSSAPSGQRGGAGKRATPHSTSSATALVSGLANANGSYNASSSSSTTVAKGKGSSSAASSSAGASSSAAGRGKGGASPPSTAVSPPPYSNTSPYNTTVATKPNPPSRPPSTLSALPGQNLYGVHPTYSAYGAPNLYGVPPFRADIFSSPEEANQFYKAVKMYERETDRTKVLLSIKEYFLPHRTVDEISTMVDLAFPTFDPSAGYNAAAALHPMYAAQGRMYGYPDASGHPQLAGFGAGNGLHSAAAGAGSGAGGPGAHQSPQVAAVAAAIAGGKLDPSTAAYLSNPALLAGYSSAAFPGMDTGDGSIDFGPAPTHIESSSLASISDRMSEHIKTEEGGSTGASQSGGHGNAGGAPRGTRASGGSDHSSNASSSGTVPNPNNAGDASGAVKKKEDDDDLMNELASLTDRPLGGGGGGLSGFLGGRPLALSPGVFGTGTGSTPLSFGMTPLGMANSTPLSFMSPLGLNFATQSPINPYFNSQK